MNDSGPAVSDEELADQAALGATLLRSLASRWRCRAEAGRLGHHPPAETARLVSTLEAAARLLDVGPPSGAEALALDDGSAERSRILIDSIPDCAIFMLDPDGRVISWNVGAERVKGYRAEEVMGQPLSIFYRQEDRDAGKPERDLQTALRDGRFAEEGVRIRRDGQPFWAQVTLTALRTAEGKLRGFGKVTRDITEARRSLEGVRQSEERLRLMVEAVRDYAIFLVDPEGRVQSWNSGAQRLKGYSESEILGRSISLFYSEEDRNRGHPQEVLRRAKAEGRYEEEGWRYRKDGSRFWANVVISPLFDPRGRHLGFAKITRDFTERREAAERLRQSEERFRLVVESVREYAVLMLDPEGYITSWSPGAERIKGYAAAEIVGQHFSRFYPDEARRSGHPAEELRLAAADGSYSEEGHRLRKDGTLFWASVTITALRNTHGQLLGFVKLTRDLTVEREAQDRLRQSEERMRLLVESVKDYAIFMLDPDGRVATWNAGAQHIKGYSSEEAIGKHFSIFYTPEDVAARRPDRELEVARAEGRYEEEGFRVRKDGRLLWVNVVLTAVYDSTGTLRGFAKVTRDLTERRRVEQETRAAELQVLNERAHAAEAQKAVEARDEFIAVAAHELRTPLTALQLKLQGIQGVIARSGGAPGLGERAQSAGRQLERMTSLIERLLDVTRISSGKLVIAPVQANLAALIAEVAEEFREPAMHAGCSLRLDAPEELSGSWDKAGIQQVVANLLSNAIKYGGGAPVEIRLEAAGPIARLVVTDRGIGVPADAVERIFGRFERAVSVQHYGGLGLGLYVTRNIVEAHGGTIRVDSRVSQGASFIVELPVRRGAAGIQPGVQQ